MRAKELFKKWLSDNISHFAFNPIIIKEDTDTIILQFEGIVDKINCIFSGHFIDICYRDSEGHSDILYEIDLPSVKRKNGRLYYCNDCKEPLFFKNVAELYKEHSFNHLLEWINEIKNEDELRIMDGSQYGFFSVEMRQKNKDWSYKEVKPLIVPICEINLV